MIHHACLPFYDNLFILVWQTQREFHFVARAREGWGKRNYSFFSFGPAARKNHWRVPAGGQKGRGLGGRNFSPPASVPVPFEQEKSGRGVWGKFRFSLAKSK